MPEIETEEGKMSYEIEGDPQEDSMEGKEEAIIYETEIFEKARKWDDMQTNMQGNLYKCFMQQMQCKINIMTAMHKGYGAISDQCKKIEEIDYEILQLLALAMKNEAQQKKEEDGNKTQTQVRSKED